MFAEGIEHDGSVTTNLVGQLSSRELERLDERTVMFVEIFRQVSMEA
jgi:hypothetical protein